MPYYHIILKKIKKYMPYYMAHKNFHMKLKACVFTAPDACSAYTSSHARLSQSKKQ